MQGRTTLLSSWEERQPDDDGFIVFSSGEPHTRAIYEAVIDRYNAVSGRAKPTEEELHDLTGTKVTLVQYGTNMLGGGLLVAQEGKLFIGTSGMGILPKGARRKGVSVKPEKVLDVFRDYSTEEAVAIADEVRAHFPTLRPLTQERLTELPPESDDRDSVVCSLALFGRNPVFGGSDCLWLIGEYWPEEDICDTNVLLIRPEFGTSEHGSCYGQELLQNRSLGEVVGFEPISFSQAIKLWELDFDEAFARVTGNLVAA
jgi:hypothetical protein